MDLSDTERFSIYIANATASAFSLIGCFFIVSMYVTFSELRGYAFKMILVLTILDIFNCVGFLIPTYDSPNDSASCHVQALLINASSFCGILWTSVIAYSLYSIISNENPEIHRKFKLQVVLLITMCIITGIIPEITGSYGRTSGWCWIVHEYRQYNLDFFERMFLLFVPLCLAIIFNSVIYAKLYTKLKLMPADSISASTQKILKAKLIMYPMILAICYLPYTVKQGVEESNANKSDYLYTYTMFSGVMRCIHGILNSVIYGLTKAVKDQIRACFYSPTKDLSIIKGVSMPLHSSY